MNLRLFILSSISLTLSFFALRADIDLDAQDVGTETIHQPAKRTPFGFDAHFDGVGAARITRKGPYKKDRIEFATADVEAGMVFYYNPTYTEGARVSLGYLPTYLKWHGNPWFDQDRFNLVTVALSGFTKRADNWFWRVQLMANIDTDELSAKYMSYDLLAWGRYAFSEQVGVHLGFWAETGLEMDRVYPILGFDWQISRQLKLNAVFPTNISLLYSLTPKWSIGVAGRFFDLRFRTKHEEHSHRPLVRYTNAGAEFTLQYENSYMSANIHAGSTLGGVFRVADKNNNHAHNYDFGASGYIGAEVDVKF